MIKSLWIQISWLPRTTDGFHSQLFICILWLYSVQLYPVIFFFLNHIFRSCIFYRACVDIPRGTELLVWYNDSYTSFFGIPLQCIAQDENCKSHHSYKHTHLLNQQCYNTICTYLVMRTQYFTDFKFKRPTEQMVVSTKYCKQIQTNFKWKKHEVTWKIFKNLFLIIQF